MKKDRSGFGKEKTKYTENGPGTPGGTSWTIEWLKFDNSYFKVCTAQAGLDLHHLTRKCTVTVAVVVGMMLLPLQELLHHHLSSQIITLPGPICSQVTFTFSVQCLVVELLRLKSAAESLLLRGCWPFHTFRV